MWWVIAPLLLVAPVVLLNVGPVRCPLCLRINVLARKRTGRRDEHDAEGDLRRSSSEFVCGRCGCLYWIVWDDFAGRWATRSEPRDPDADR
jgi:hypothetical protein